jgi:LacI family transcriptional regulator
LKRVVFDSQLLQAKGSVATPRDIARLTGLSLPTVGHILGNRGHRYRKETQEKVWQVALELGYRPNPAAAAMLTRRFNAVGMLLSVEPHRSNLPVELFDSIHDELARHNFHLSVAKFSDRDLVDETFVRKMAGRWMVDGFLINYFTDFPLRMAELLDRFKIPFIWMNSPHTRDCVYPDDIQAGRMAAEKLIALGHRRIAFYDPTGTVHYSSSDRRAGYSQAMQEAGLQPNIVQTPYLTCLEQVPDVEALLTSESRPTAIILYRERSVEVVCAIARKHGIVVPRDLSLLLFHHTPLDSTVGFISRMVIPYEKMGLSATQLLLQRIKGENVGPFPPTVVPFDFDPGTSCVAHPAE